MMLSLSKPVRASVTAEASMVMPIVVICILPFIYLFRMFLCQLVLEHGVDECVRQIAQEVYVLERISKMPEYREEEEVSEVEDGQLTLLQELIDEYTYLVEEEGWKQKLEEAGFEFMGELLLEQKLKNWLEAEDLEAWGIEGGWDGLSVRDSDFFYVQEGHHYLIKGAISFSWKKLFAFWDPGTVTIQRIYHSFVGEEEQQAAEEDQEGTGAGAEIVYRIGEGVRYHRSSCYLINKDSFSTTRSGAVEAGCAPCDRCSPQKLTTVYRTAGGEHYHTQDCSYLNPSVVSLTLEEALQKGYQGCGLCHGDKAFFS